MSFWNFIGEFALFNMICNLFSGRSKSLFKNKCLFQADGFLGKFHLSRRSIVGYVTETKMEFHKNPSEMR